MLRLRRVSHSKFNFNLILTKDDIDRLSTTGLHPLPSISSLSTPIIWLPLAMKVSVPLQEETAAIHLVRLQEVTIGKRT